MVRLRPARDELNRALHELRRPLQALVLMEHDRDGPVAGIEARRRARRTRAGLLQLVAVAVGDLDRAVNGGPASSVARERVDCRVLVLETLERWHGAAPLEGAVGLSWRAGDALIDGQPARLAQALDNVLANAFEHGAPPVRLTGVIHGGRLRIVVTNGARPGGYGDPRQAFPRDPGRGYGLRIASEVALAHGGRFAFSRTEDGSVAALELPLAAQEPARAA